MPSLAFLVLLSACKPDAPDPAVVYYRDVKPVVDARCTGCHVDGGIGPFPLTTYEECSAAALAMADAVGEGRMPPWPPDADCNDYQHDRSLTGDQIALVEQWAALDAPEGDAQDEGPPLVADDGLSRVDLALEMAEPYTMTMSPDEYRCFLIEWPETQDLYVTGFEAVPGNPSIVHHVIAYRVDPTQVDDYVTLDESDVGPGYSCFGGPGGDVATGAAWIGGWVPGSLGEDFPEGTGIRMEAGSLFVVQVHYNAKTSDPAPDQTSFALKLDASVDDPARIVKLVDPRWNLEDSMIIPAGEADVMHSFEFTNETNLTARVHSAGLHMHTLGTKGSISLSDAGGAETCVLDIPVWDFHWQGMYQLETTLTFAPGDTARIECHWDNSAGTEDVGWGENTTDEMCLGMIYLTEG
jgi:hypothetical protein